ncbi:MAG: hypothetical protein MMC33_002299 [Icmadophila ericetorum]|nr:hypothetical protein [Icmadophila ericetorum]
MADPRVARSSYLKERRKQIPKLKYRNYSTEPSSQVNENSFYTSSTDTESSRISSPTDPQFNESIRSSHHPPSIPPRTSSDSRRHAKSKLQHEQQSVLSESKSTKSKKSSVLRFFTVKEPSAQALLDYQESILKHQAAPNGKVKIAGLPMVSSKQLPPEVPKVNSKWDGVPEIVKERGKSERTSKRRYTQPLKAAIGLFPNKSDTRRDSSDPFAKGSYTSSKSVASLISSSSASTYGEDFSHLASLVNIGRRFDKQPNTMEFPPILQHVPPKDMPQDIAVPKNIARIKSQKKPPKIKPVSPSTSREDSAENYKFLDLSLPGSKPIPRSPTLSTPVRNKSFRISQKPRAKLLPTFDSLQSTSTTDSEIKTTVLEIHSTNDPYDQSSSKSSTPSSISTPLEARRRARLAVLERYEPLHQDHGDEADDTHTQLYSRPVVRTLNSLDLPHGQLPVNIGPGIDEHISPLSAAFPGGDAKRSPRLTVNHMEERDGHGDMHSVSSRDRNVAPWDYSP